MRSPLNTTTITILALAFPIAALANLTGTPTLSTNIALSLDTGVTSASGGDIFWNGVSMTPQGSAAAINLGPQGTSAFNLQTQSTLSAYTYSQSPLTSLIVNDLFAVHTNGGNYAAVLVTAVSPTSITLQFTTFGASSVSGAPSITGVQNNFSYTLPGFANSGIAQGALFIVVGTGLASIPTAQVVEQNPTNGLPTTLNGATVKVTSGGSTVVPAFYYAGNTVLALVLPSSTPLGAAQITVTYNGLTSAPFSFQVVQSAMGFDTYYGTGTGLGVAQNPTTGGLYNYNNAIPPGTTVVLWGSGLGADTAVDTTAVVGAFAINNLQHVYVGGIDASIGYQGESGPGYPGVDEVVITIPANAPTGCNVSVVGVAAGAPTSFITLPIGNGPCSDPLFGTSGSQLTNLSGQPTAVKTGFVAIEQTTSGGNQASNLAIASFQTTTGSAYGSSIGLVSPGSCIITSEGAPPTGAAGTSTGLGAGTITVTGPAGGTDTLASIPQVTGLYEAMLPAGFIPTSGGTFTFQGAAGTSVGAFNAPINLPGPVLTWTNQLTATTVTRSAGLPVSWAGGGSGTYVSVIGSSSGTVGGQAEYATFTCVAPATAGQLTVPNYVLAVLPPGSGSVSVANYTSYQPFTATGLDFAYSVGFVSYSVTSKFN